MDNGNSGLRRTQEGQSPQGREVSFRLAELKALSPNYVHPGRGETGGPELIDRQAAYLREVLGRVVLYSGDDSRFEYVYRFVSDAAWDPKDAQRTDREVGPGRGVELVGDGDVGHHRPEVEDRPRAEQHPEVA